MITEDFCTLCDLGQRWPSVDTTTALARTHLGSWIYDGCSHCWCTGNGASVLVQLNLAEAGRLRAPRPLPRVLRGVHRMDHSTARNLETQPLHLPRATVSCFTRRASFRGDRLLPFSSAHEDAMLGCFRRVAEQRSLPPTFVTDAAIAGHIFRLNLARPKSSFWPV